jgi:hypothetical protein
VKVHTDKFLKRIFSSIQPHQGGVTFHLNRDTLLNEGFTGFTIIEPSKTLEAWANGYRTFSQGGTFQIIDHHHMMVYTIVQIEDDGVVVGYSPGQVPPPKGPPPIGSVKLTWR